MWNAAGAGRIWIGVCCATWVFAVLVYGNWTGLFVFQGSVKCGIETASDHVAEIGGQRQKWAGQKGPGKVYIECLTKTLT